MRWLVFLFQNRRRDYPYRVNRMTAVSCCLLASLCLPSTEASADPAATSHPPTTDTLTAGQQDQALPAGVDPATGFRMSRYRAPVPDHLPGGNVMNTDEVLAATARQDTVLIDVYPPRGAGADPLNGNWLLAESHDFIDGSTWLPEVGRGYLEAGHTRYFRDNLEALTGGDRDQAVVFYCTADCWQSWNAARRAIVWGWRAVFWYPEGTDGWLDAGLPLVSATPINFFETVHR